MKSSYSALGLVGLALAGLWYAGGGSIAPTAAAETVRVSAPVSHDNLTVFFIHGPDAKIATLQEALAAGTAIVHETGNVNSLVVENLSADTELFIQEGDMISGGRQDRLIAQDMLVSPKSGKIPLPVHCVEHGRWTGRGNESSTTFGKSDQFVVGNRIRYANARGQQGKVWTGTTDEQAKLSAKLGVKVNAAESESSLQLALENPVLQAKVAPFVQALGGIRDEGKNVIGVVFVVNGEVRGHEEYGSNALFRKAWPKLLNARAIEAVAWKTDRTIPSPPSVGEVERFVAFGPPQATGNGSGSVADPNIFSNIEMVDRGTTEASITADAIGMPNSPDTDTRALTSATGSFPGRSGATYSRTIREGGVNFNTTTPAQDSVIMAGSGAGRVDEAQLRRIAQIWSSQSAEQKTRTRAELLREVPERYRARVEEYFRALDRQQANNGIGQGALGGALGGAIGGGQQGALGGAMSGSLGGGTTLQSGQPIQIEGNSVTRDRVQLNSVPLTQAARRADARAFAGYSIQGLGVANPRANPNGREVFQTEGQAGNRLNVSRVDGGAGLASESRDPSRANAVIHKSFIKK